MVKKRLVENVSEREKIFIARRKKYVGIDITNSILFWNVRVVKLISLQTI